MSIPRPNSTIFARPDLALMGTAAIAGVAGLAIANRVLPPVNVTSRTGEIWKMKAESLGQISPAAREPGSGYARVNTKFDRVTFMTQEYGLEEPIPDENRSEFGSVLAGDAAVATRLIDQLVRLREQRVATLCINETTYPASGSTGVTVGTAWTSASATPVTNVNDAIENIRKRTGAHRSMMRLVVPQPTFDKIPQITDFITKMKIDSQGLSADQLPALVAQYFGIGGVDVGGLTYNAAIDGQTESWSDIWNKNYCFLYVPMQGEPRASEDTIDARFAGLGISPRWVEQDSGNYNVETYRDEQTRTDVVRARENIDEYPVHTVYANLIKGVNP